MTGSEIKDKFNTYIDEVGSGFFDDLSLQLIFNKANINIVDRKIEEFQRTQKVTREMQPLINVTTPITITNAQIDVSVTSTTVPNYYSFISLKITSPYRETTIEKYAKERIFDQFSSNFTAGIPRYPVYFFTAGMMNIEPTNATLAVFTYFRTPIVIDITDTTTDIGYNQKLIELFIDEAMVVAGIKGRDFAIKQAAAEDEIRNP